MPCPHKRGHEREMIAFRMGYLCKRVLAFDLGSMSRRPDCTRKTHRSRSPDERRVSGMGASYWSQTASSLSSDVVGLTEALKTRDRDYYSLMECNTRLLRSYKELERRLIDADREIVFLKTDPFQESRVYSSIVSTIPVNTQGKDALHWHQVCRSVQLQYLEAKHEIDEKTNQFIMLSNRIRELESLLSDKRNK